jgi:general secretion pathway protein G
MENRHRGGFTLIEIMAVVLIIGMLSALVGVAIIPQINKGKVTTARTQIKNLEAALETYNMDNAGFPTSEQGLNALINAPPEARNYQTGGYLREHRIPEDPWNNAYQYESPGQHNQQSFDLWSWGADGKPGGTGADADIGNWVEDAGSGRPERS